MRFWFEGRLCVGREAPVSDWLMKTIRAEARRLMELAAGDEELRADLRGLAEEILAFTSRADLPSEGAPVGRESAEPLRELTLGQSPMSPKNSSIAPVSLPKPSRSGEDVASLEARCRRKAEAARWAAECQRRIGEGADPIVSSEEVSLDQELAGWIERLTDSFYWMSSKSGEKTNCEAFLDEVAGCLEAVAESLALAVEVQGHSKAFESALHLVAEAQSALRRAFQRLEIASDPDQESVYEWLRATAARHHVYLRRHMRADDLAEPSAWPSLLARIEQTRASGRKSPRQITELERIRLHQTEIREGRETDGDWPAIIEAVDALVKSGLPPSHREIRDLVLPIIDQVPDRDELLQSFRLVLREIDQFLATRPSQAFFQSTPEPSEEVKEVARLLGGKSIVLIGGRRRRDSQEALRRAFELASLLWIETREHQSIESFKPIIARPEVAMALLAIRWSSHGFGEIRHLCERHGKPLVRLPGGYSPNQVAAQILTQSSDQLSAGGGFTANDDRV